MSEQADYFTSIAKQWDTMVHHDPAKIAAIISMLSLPPRARVLDVGCGTGVMSRPLLAAAQDVIVQGIDLSSGMIQTAQEKHKDLANLSYLVGDAVDTDLSLGSFDLILCYSMFPHFSDQPAALRTLATRLAPKGKLCIAHSQSRDAINHLHETSDEQVAHDRLPPMYTLQAWMEQAGLQVVATVDDQEMYVCVAQAL